MSTEQTRRDHQSRPTPSCHAPDATRAGPHSHWLACSLAGVMLAVSLTLRCIAIQSADGKVTYSDQPCAVLRVACASSRPAPKSRQAMDKFHQIAEENPKPQPFARKRRNATLVTQAHVPNGTDGARLLQVTDQKLEPVARK